MDQRREEIEAAVFTRVAAVAEPPGENREYTEGLRGAVSAAVEHCIDALEVDEERALPVALLAQARLAARHGIGLEAVMRCCAAGHSLIVDFLLAEADASAVPSGFIQRLLRSLSAVLDRLLVEMSEEYTREARRRQHSAGQRNTERIERLLAGELLDTTDIPYDFEAHHLAVIGAGKGALEPLHELAGGIDCRLLTVEREEDLLWAWIGSRKPVDLEALTATISPPALLCLGEPAQGIAGWRLTHRQATAALAVARHGDCKAGLLCYYEVALLAAVLADEPLAALLRERYLVPLRRERDGGQVLRQTLRAYFSCSRNVSSAAALLGTRRNTVANRLRAAERRLGCELASCALEIEIALEIDNLLGC
jgi:PucR-like helix-turn-helix protein/diguanylate cyclase with GGDEF domain